MYSLISFKEAQYLSDHGIPFVVCTVEWHPQGISTCPVQWRAFDVVQSKPLLDHLHELQSWQTVLEPVSPKAMTVLLEEPKDWSDLNNAIGIMFAV